MRALVVGPDKEPRCFWAGSAPEYVRYHDEEWGFPADDDVHLFEMVCLEGFQAGLSWLTILRKRDAFRRAFAGFALEEVARFGARDVTRLLADAGIVRHRGKIESTLNNARRACELRDELGSLAAYFWSFEPDPGARPRRLTLATLRRMTTTPESVALSKDLRRRGWTFVGPTTLYSFMQAVGIVNDHLDGCAVRLRAERARRLFRARAPGRPGRARGQAAGRPLPAVSGATDRRAARGSAAREGQGPRRRAPGHAGR